MAEDTPKPAAPIKKAPTKTAPKAKPATAAPATKQPAAAKPATAKPAAKPKASAKDAFADVTGAATQTLKEGAAKMTKEATGKARAYAEDGKARVGGVLDELSKMMGDAAGTVDEKVGAQYGNYARSAADAVSGFSESLKSKNVDDIVADARDFVKKSPAIAIGTAAAIGFVLVRLIKSGLDSDDRA
ncbi:hypothetical protein QH494_13270 [Sphingomonas sp. AR_OL41]|uniref:hypothetical protein n=1 Tax=Sphingomonas sp. AR_OL41 TaxID=3042729 RepID=UPI002480B2EB|nr:hypothetical protein [Sphingomonas sp. AR_OL41]MDH7973153.1 hypothetical protein [Sphingomonas sp. AR_OL41]